MSQHVRQIPLRVAVTGTRGKSTVARLIVAALREAGLTVLARTTGSRAALLLPDGREEELPRRGLPTILEGKKILKMGARLGVRALCVELMSIRPECLVIESRRIFHPHILVVTNVRLDHREEMGGDKPEVARSLASAIPPKATVFIPDTELYPEFHAAADRLQAKIVGVGKNGGSVSFEDDNITLALAVTGSLGVPNETALRGIARATPDFGSLKIWDAPLGNPPSAWLLVSAFAANEPESTGLILARLKERFGPAGRRLIGVLNLRLDRGDRTRQWLDALHQGFFSEFHRLYIIGAHVHSLKIKTLTKRFPFLAPLPGNSPRLLMEKIAAAAGPASILLGMGNMGGLGGALVEYWDRIGRLHAF